MLRLFETQQMRQPLETSDNKLNESISMVQNQNVL